MLCCAHGKSNGGGCVKSILTTLWGHERCQLWSWKPLDSRKCSVSVEDMMRLGRRGSERIG